MTRFLYTLLLRLLAPLIWLWMARRARKAGGQWGIFSGARFGHYRSTPQPDQLQGRVWVHAVSLGETRAAQPLLKRLLHDGHRLLLTHTTATGRAEGQRLFPEAVASGQLLQTWLPYDFPGSVRRFLRYFAPRCGILIEREVWPNLIHGAQTQFVPMMLVSARFSESSLRQSRWLGGALRRAYAALDMVLAQTQADADRLRQVGVRQPLVVGNLKFDVSLPATQLLEGRQWRDQIERPVIAYASTREGEEAMFAEVIAGLRTADLSPLHIVIPRHPQRFSEAGAVLRDKGLSVQLRSDAPAPPSADTQVLLGDSLGEMGFYYAAADVAIVAGGFAPLGGQNLIEACAAGTPVIVGPHMFNFAQATADAVAAGAAIQVDDAETAVREAYALLRDPDRRVAMKAAGLKWSTVHAGATERIMKALQPWLGVQK